MLVAGAHGERPRLGDRLGTVGARWTSLAIRLCKPHMDDGMRVSVVSGYPLYTPAPVGAGHRVRVPIHCQGRHLDPLLRFLLPTGVRVHWPQQYNVGLFVTGNQVLCGDLPRIHQVVGR